MKIFVTEKIVAECKIMFMLSGKLLNVNGYIREIPTSKRPVYYSVYCV